MTTAATIRVPHRAARGAASRTAILDAAVRLVERHGLANTSLGDIAREARTSKPAVLYHFQSRANLLREMANHVLEGLLSCGVDKVSGIRVGEVARRMKITLDFTFSADMRPFHVLIRELLVLGLRDPVVAQTVRDCMRRVASVVESELPAHWGDRAIVADDMVTAVQGFINLWLCSADGDPEPFLEAALRICQQQADCAQLQARSTAQR